MDTGRMSLDACLGTAEMEFLAMARVLNFIFSWAYPIYRNRTRDISS
jgi:hypothetical protein